MSDHDEPRDIEHLFGTPWMGASDVRCLACKRRTMRTLIASPFYTELADVPARDIWVESGECPYCQQWGRLIHEIELSPQEWAREHGMYMPPASVAPPDDVRAMLTEFVGFYDTPWWRRVARSIRNLFR